MPRTEDGYDYGDDCMTLEDWRDMTGDDFPEAAEKGEAKRI